MAASMALSGCRTARRCPRGPLPRRRARPERVGRARRLPWARPLRRALVALAAPARRRPAPPAGDRAAARALAVRPAPPLSPPPSAYRQGTRGLRLGRGARAAPHARRCASGRRTARPADPRRRPRRRTGRLGLPVGRADAVELLSGGQPERRRHGLRGERAARGRRRAGSGRPRRPCARGRALGPRRALDRAGGLLRVSRGPAREHPQRQPPGRVAGRRCGWGGSPRPRAGGAGRAANARRAAPRWVVAVRRGAQPRLGGLLSLGLRAAVPGPPARRGRPHRRGGAARRGAATAGSSTRQGARGCGRTSRFPRMRTRPARA